MQKEPIESFWDALWLGIRPLLCFYGARLNSAKLNLLPNEPIESFWDALWLGIQPVSLKCKAYGLIGWRCSRKGPSAVKATGKSPPEDGATIFPPTVTFVHSP